MKPTVSGALHAARPDVSVIVVSYNTRELTLDCLRSVYQQTRAVDFEILVVDNASADGSPEAVAHEFPAVHLHALDRNLGFAAANNIALRAARGRYLLLLNPDTLILDGALERMVRFMDADQSIGAAGCQVLQDAETIQQTCFRFPSCLNLFLAFSGLQRAFPHSRWLARGVMGDWDRRSPRDVDVISGMFLMIRRAALVAVGLLDQRFFVYAEEADWCRRAADRGWRRVFTPSARILHRDGGGASALPTGARMYVQMQKSLLLYLRKHQGLAAECIGRSIFVSAMLARAFLALISGARRRAAASSAGNAWAALRFHVLGTDPR